MEEFVSPDYDSKPLTILSVAYPLAPVGPDAVGGAEQVLSRLDEALVRMGHRSVVIACEGSVTQGTLLATSRAHGRLDDRARKMAWEQHRRAIREALERWPIDVVHLHGVDFLEYLPSTGVPTLATLHLPPHWYPQEIFHLTRPSTYLHCVSATQRKGCPSCDYLLPEIGNGVPADLFQARHAKRGYAISLGRICPEKGFHLGFDAATQAGVPLVLAGEVFGYETHEHYFRTEILPRVKASHRFIGPVGWNRKRRLLCAAQCLLAPSLVAETSSLVAMEALACGTPVVAFPSGALAEIVEHGKTGFLVHNAQEMAAAIRHCETIEPETCRTAARQRFDVRRMTEKYFEVYRLLTDSSFRNTMVKGVEWEPFSK